MLLNVLQKKKMYLIESNLIILYVFEYKLFTVVHFFKQNIIIIKKIVT